MCIRDRLGSVYAIYRRFFLPQQYWVEGWTATFVGIMFFGGVQLLTIGIIGEYIARIYAQIQNRGTILLKRRSIFNRMKKSGLVVIKMCIRDSA